MAPAASSEDQPDQNQNSGPVMPLQQDLSPEILTGETFQPQDKGKCDDDQELEDPIEEETNADDPDTELQVTTTTSSPTITAGIGSFCGGGTTTKKMATKRRAQEKMCQKKLEVLTETLKPIPFVPSKKLDFSSHEMLLKRIGLWDFVHLEFDGNVRNDLIAQLIATYNSESRCSYVNGCHIRVSRADLARALKLSVKKDKDKDKDGTLEVEESKESIGFVEEVVSKWVLMHEDTWMMPMEVLNWNKMIKEGHFDKVDWAGLIWFMVEKELMAAPKLENCYYASHMQSLIKFQRVELLQEESKMDVDEAEEEEEHNIQEDVKTDADEIDKVHGGLHLEEHNNELCLGGQDNLMNEDDDEKEAGRHEDTMDCEETKEDGFPMSPKGEAFEGVNSTNLLEAMETGDLHFTTGFHIRHNSSGEFITTRGNTQTVPGVSSFLGNGNNREIGHDKFFSHHSLNGSNKRLRTDGQWTNKSSEFDICMEQMQHCMAKARMLYAAKDQAYADASMHQQMLLDQLQRKDSIIEYLQKAKYEEQTKRQVEVHRLEHELFMMENLLNGYRKALKETNKAFTEYRARFRLSDEPLYKDVSGSGGLVLSTMELEKQLLKQEEEDRLNKSLIEKRIKDFEAGWIGKFEAHKDAISLFSIRLIDAEKDVNLLKELFANRKSPDTPECVP
ncbi:hypothetical protein CCACVL1_18176 [Corchorus capsularis]|uniref:Uncharacterized protein n=1 Tax=Corchorus capsularis TaxID=210143 RepID=A0A1R3HMT7_COCAP|nr:hypothetical protein CCACVL1_18176 [Corchorus capsularis]